jgi:hypothetical protein
MLNAQQNQPKMPSAFPTIITQVLSHLASFVKVSPFGKPRECYDKNQSEKHVYRQPFVPDLDAHPRVLKQQKEKEDVVTGQNEVVLFSMGLGSVLRAENDRG